MLDLSKMTIIECFNLATKLGEAIEGVSEAMDPEKAAKQAKALAKFQKHNPVVDDPSKMLGKADVSTTAKKSNFGGGSASEAPTEAPVKAASKPVGRLSADGSRHADDAAEKPVEPKAASEAPKADAKPEAPKAAVKPEAEKKAPKVVKAKEGKPAKVAKDVMKALKSAQAGKSGKDSTAKAAGKKAGEFKAAIKGLKAAKGGKKAKEAPKKFHKHHGIPKGQKKPFRADPTVSATDKAQGHWGNRAFAHKLSQSDEKHQSHAATMAAGGFKGTEQELSSPKPSFGGHQGSKRGTDVGTASKHSPFGKFSKLGDESPRHSEHDESDKWKCHGTEKEQKCIGIGDNVDKDGNPHHKTVHQWKHKDAYQKEYKAGLAKGRYVPGWRSGNKGETHKQINHAKKFGKEKGAETHHRHNAGRSLVAASHKGWDEVTPGARTSKQSPHDEKIFQGVRSGEVHPDHATHEKNMLAKMKKTAAKASKASKSKKEAPAAE